MALIKINFDQDSWKKFLYINGEKQEHISIAEKREKTYIRLNNTESTEELLSHKIVDFPEFYKITGKIKSLILNAETTARVFIRSLEHNCFNVDFQFRPDFVSLKVNYNFSDYIEVLKDEIKSSQLFDDTKFGIEGISRNGFSLSFENIFVDKTFKKTTDNLNDRIIKLDRLINKKLNENSKLIFSFIFPNKLKIPCEQYLLYFAQFLQDLGINATSNLKEEAGKVLFSVTPTDDVEALDKIREALAVYLNLPASPIVYDDSFAAMRLQQQIENLQHSQRMAVRELQFNEKLFIAQSDTIREKNITISQQQSVIEQQDKIIEKISSKSIMMDSAENKEELEKIYEGVKIGESKWLKELTGVGFNPAKAIKTAVKNTFGKESVGKSILGLDENASESE